MDDAELLMRWRGGDKEAGNELYERYFYSLDAFFTSKLDEEGAKDLIQETFLACMESRDRIVDAGKFRSYLFSVAYNKLKDFLRRRYRRGEQVDLENVSMYMLAPGSSLSSLLAKRDEERILLEALYRIPVQHQTLIELHYWESLTTEEISHILEIPVGTVRTRLSAVRRDLGKLIPELAKSTSLRDSTLEHFREWEEQRRNRLSKRNGGEEGRRGGPGTRDADEE